MGLAIKFVEKIESFVTFKKNTKEDKNVSMFGMIVVFSGFRDKKLEEYIVKNGGKVSTSVSKNTTLVVVLNINNKFTGKSVKAEELGVEIISKDEFINRYVSD